MSEGQRISHVQALNIAVRFVEQLAGTYERVAIAGSLRRGRETVGDIEIVIRPALSGPLNLLGQRVADLLRQKVVTLRRKSNGALLANGSRYKALTFRDFPVDLFIVMPDRHFGPTLLIRTGPGDANQVLVTTAHRRAASGDYGILPPGLRFESGALWMGEAQLHTPEEEHVFAACGLPWIPPHLRSVQIYQEQASGRPRQAVTTLAGWEITTDCIYVFGKPTKVDLPAPVSSGSGIKQLSLFG